MEDFTVYNGKVVIKEIIKELEKDINSYTSLDISKLQILKKFENKKTKKIFLQSVTFKGNKIPKKYQKKEVKDKYGNVKIQEVSLVFKNTLYSDEWKSNKFVYASKKTAEKYLINFIKEKTGIKDEKDFNNFLMQDYKKYIYIKSRDFDQSSIKNAYEKIKDSKTSTNVERFLDAISSLDTIENYINTVKINKDFLLEEINIGFFNMVKENLERLQYIIKTPEHNMKYVFENNCDPIFKNILNIPLEDERVILTKKILSLLPFDFEPTGEDVKVVETPSSNDRTPDSKSKKTKTIKQICEDDFKEIYDKLDEIEEINKDFFNSLNLDNNKDIPRDIFSKVITNEKITNIVRLDNDSNPNYKHLYNFYCDNWGSNHLSYKRGLTLIDIFEVVWTHPFGDSKKNTLLLHGSPLANWKSIINGGMRLPSHAGMFGAGIYFANCFGKSYGYVRPSGTNQNICLGLFEVKLGNMLKLQQANNTLNRNTLDSKYDSVWGQGTSSYDQFDELDGAKLYKHRVTKTKTALLHDEFIIYNPALCRLRYLFFIKN